MALIRIPREVFGYWGSNIFLLMMATAFMGYVLALGTNEFLGCNVITNLVAIPLVGESISNVIVGRIQC